MDTDAPAGPSRRPRISREYLDAYRRRRYFLAAAEVTHEFGRQGLTVTTLCQVAHTARNTFYDAFKSIDDCLEQAVAHAFEQIASPLGAPPGGGEWPAEMVAAVRGFYGRVAEEPLLAELLLVHSFSLKDGGAEHGFEGVVHSVGKLLEPGRQFGSKLGVEAPATAEEMAARTLVAAAQQALLAGRTEALPDQARPLLLIAAGGLVGSDGSWLDKV
jgi:AcrR family transcriptional regulator